MFDAQDAPAGAVLGEEAREDMRRWLAGYAPLYEIETAQIADGLLSVLAPRVAALVSAAEQRGAEKARRRCVEIVRAWADVYPESVFPADSLSREAIAGTALRTVLPRVAARLVEPDEEETR